MPFTYVFFIHALLATVLASLIAGILGPVVVERRLSLISGGMAHIAFGGIGLGYFLSRPPLLFGIAFSLASGLLLAHNHNRVDDLQDGYIASFWAIGMSLGVLFISLTPGYTPSFASFLFGSILSVSTSELVMMAGLLALILAVTLHAPRAWELYLLDEEYYRALGHDSARMTWLLYALLSVSVVLLIKVVGILLIIALLAIPAVSARRFSSNLASMIGWSTLFALAGGLGGLYLSDVLALPSGATMVLLLGAMHGLSLFVPRSKV